MIAPNLEDLCVWSLVAQASGDIDKKCYTCDGYDFGCLGYESCKEAESPIDAYNEDEK